MPHVKSRDALIYYEVHGEGPPLVLAHGAGGNTQIWWQQVPYFASHHRVVTFDHRCFGRSTCAPDSFKPEFFGDDLILRSLRERMPPPEGQQPLAFYSGIHPHIVFIAAEYQKLNLF